MPGVKASGVAQGFYFDAPSPRELAVERRALARAKNASLSPGARTNCLDAQPLPPEWVTACIRRKFFAQGELWLL